MEEDEENNGGIGHDGLRFPTVRFGRHRRTSQQNEELAAGDTANLETMLQYLISEVLKLTADIKRSRERRKRENNQLATHGTASITETDNDEGVTETHSEVTNDRSK